MGDGTVEPVASVSSADAMAPLERLWAEVVGNGEVVARLRRAAASPSHAYLLVGPSGVGTRRAARALAAELLVNAGDPADSARHALLVGKEQHPALVVFERSGPSITADQAREIQRRAQLSPPEGSVQVLLLVDFHLVSVAAPILLKSIEEPPKGTIFVILADELPPEMVTIASRCVRFDFAPLSDSEILGALAAAGVTGERAAAVCRAAAGSLDRALLLATDDAVMSRESFWRSLPERLDGKGATAVQRATEALAQIEGVLEPLTAQQAAETDEFTRQSESMGIKVTALKEIEARHARERRRIRSEELTAGLAAVMDRYRAEAARDPNVFLRAAAEVERFEQSMVFNPNEELALTALCLRLPPCSATA